MSVFNHKLVWVLLLLGMVSLSSCRHMIRVDNPAIITNYLAKIEAHNSRVKQLKATLDIKGHGFIGSFFHEQADIVAQAPDKLFWSLRSFFGSPALMIASNGKLITIYDFLGQAPSYRRFSLKDEKFFDLLGFSFHPQSIIVLLLAQIPLGTDIKLSSINDQVEICSILDGGWEVISVLDTANDRVIKTSLYNAKEDISFRAVYKDFRKISGIDFPKSLVLKVRGRSKLANLDIEMSNIDLNGDPVSSKAFYLEPH